MKSKVIVDWDGTLHNSMESVFNAYSVLIGKPVDYIKKNYDPNWKEFLKKENTPEPSVQRWKELLEMSETLLFPGAAEYVKKMRKDDYRLAIVSSTNSMSLNSDLQRFGIKNFFDTLVTFEDVKRIKPDPEGIRVAIERLKTGTKDCVYIGDAKVDADAAKRIGMDFVGVGWGFDSPEAIKNVNDDEVALSFDELYEIVKGL